jgi:hypothetical protein
MREGVRKRLWKTGPGEETPRRGAAATSTQTLPPTAAYTATATIYGRRDELARNLTNLDLNAHGGENQDSQGDESSCQVGDASALVSGRVRAMSARAESRRRARPSFLCPFC